MRSVSLLVLALEDHFSQIRIAVRSVCGDDELHLIVKNRAQFVSESEIATPRDVE